jgi:large subunit ribosomal protein L30
MSGRLRVRLRKSTISYTARARGTVRALGLHHVNDTAEVPDNDATRGMVRAVRFLVDSEAVAEPAGGEPADRRATAARGPRAAAKQEAAAKPEPAVKPHPAVKPRAGVERRAASEAGSATGPEATADAGATTGPEETADAGVIEAPQAAPAPAKRARSREEKA